MRRSIVFLPAVVLACSLAPFLAWADAPGPERARGPVAVYRGGQANVSSGVAVYRGSSSMGLPPGAPARRRPEVVAGDRLWLLDPDDGELVACRTGASGDIGRDRIRCAVRPLPRLAR